MQKKHKGKYGTIIIEFYKTERVNIKFDKGRSANNNRKYEVYEDDRREKSKKSIIDMTIGEGSSFQCETNKYHPNERNQHRKRSRSRDRENDENGKYSYH